MTRQRESAARSRMDVLEGAAERLKLAAETAARKARALRRPILAWTTARIPLVDPIDLFERSGILTDDRTLWARPDDRFGLVGLGRAWAFTARGPARFMEAGAAWRYCLDGAAGGDVAGADAPGADTPGADAAGFASGAGPLALAGFSFAPGGPADPAWDGYPAGAVVLPRVLVSSVGNASWLTISEMVGPDGRDHADAGPEIAACLDILRDAMSHETRVAGAEQRAAAYAGSRNGDLEIEESPSAEEWKAAVGRAALAVRQGSLRKIVLAREIRVRGVQASAALLLRRLRADYPSCTIFAVARGDRCFLGATPERLVRVRGGQVSTTAVAGSAPRGLTEGDDRRLGEMLLASPKDRLEHAVVVEALRDVFAQTCTEIAVGAAPTLLKVRNVQHLLTPLTGRLRDHLCVLDLVDRLHPTPAVGGDPRDEALQWLARHEGLERGWYAGPVGWIDRAGEGEFAVAIRSTLLRGLDALLFAGCGIVADSDPDQEYAESWLKLRPVLSAMGIPEPW